MTKKPTYEELEKRVKELEKESILRGSEERYRTLVEESFDGIFIQKGTRIVFANQRLHEMLGYNEGELLDMDHWIVYHPEYQDLTRERAQARMKGETVPTHYEVKLQRKNGSWFYGDVGARPIHLDGEAGIQVWIKDTMNRKQAEEALRVSEEKYRDLYDNAPDMLVSVDAKTATIIECNQTLADELGYTKEEIIGRPIFDMYTLDSAEYAKANVFPVFAKNGIVKEEELQLQRKDGSMIDVSLNVTAVRDEKGNILSSRSSWRDITERKRLETQLQQAQKMETIGTLAGGIAHDFNNILAAIIGYAELVKMKLPEDSEVLPNLDEVLKSSNRAKTLIQQILAFSRKQELEQKPLQLKYIVKESLKLLRSTLPSDIEIKEDIAKDVGVVNADPTQMHQVIMNLCTNAGHAMQKDGGVLTVGLANVELDDIAAAQYLDMSPGRYLRVTVSDTGYGMTSDVKDHIFDPYFTTKEKGVGTGLGLSVAHGIVKNHNGEITVYSEPGKGSTFHVYLPLIQEEAIKPEIDEQAPILTGNERILFIDDEKALVDLGTQMLESLGYKVTTRTSSIEALELFKAQPDQFDLVITDMTMPKMTGDHLAKELMKIRPDIPIIICTGHSGRISEEKASSLSIRKFVMKPIVMSDIAKTVREVLDT